MRRHAALMLAALLIGPMAAAAAAGASPAPAVVVIDKMAFGPAPRSLHVGQTIVWDNRDMFQHSATDRAGAFDLVLKPGAKGRTKLTRAGRVDVYCRYHPGMKLTLNVAK